MHRTWVGSWRRSIATSESLSNSIILWGINRANEMDDVGRKACLVGGPTASLSQNASNGTTTVATKGAPVEQLGKRLPTGCSMHHHHCRCHQGGSIQGGRRRPRGYMHPIPSMQGPARRFLLGARGRPRGYNFHVRHLRCNQGGPREGEVPGKGARLRSSNDHQGSPNYTEMYLRWSRDADYDMVRTRDGTED